MFEPSAVQASDGPRPNLDTDPLVKRMGITHLFANAKSFSDWAQTPTLGLGLRLGLGLGLRLRLRLGLRLWRSPM